MTNSTQTTEKKQDSCWSVYILRCADGTLYTGITNDLLRRVAEHNSQETKSKGAKYTKARQPVTLAYSENAKNRSEASRREYQIKQLSRQKKLQLCQAQHKQ